MGVMTKQTWGRPEHERAISRVLSASRQRYDTQTEFAAALGWSMMKVSRVLHGQSKLNLPDLLHVCRVLRLSADWVLGLTPDESFAKVRAPDHEGLAAIPLVLAEDLDDDLKVLRSDAVAHLPAFMVGQMIAGHSGGPAPATWEHGRFVLTPVGPLLWPEFGAVLLVDRRPCMDPAAQGCTMIARLGDGVEIGRLYSWADGLMLVREGAAPQGLDSWRCILGAVVAAIQPVAAVG